MTGGLSAKVTTTPQNTDWFMAGLVARLLVEDGACVRAFTLDARGATSPSTSPMVSPSSGPSQTLLRWLLSAIIIKMCCHGFKEMNFQQRRYNSQ